MTDKNKKKIILHITFTSLGGLGTFLKLITDNIHSYNQKLICFSEIEKDFFDKRVEILDKPKVFYIKEEPVFVNIFRYIRILKSVDIIHVHHSRLWLFTTPLFLFSKKTIYSFHTSFGSGIKKTFCENILIALIINYCVVFSSRIVFLTKGQKFLLEKYSVFKDIYKRKSLVVNNFISKELITQKSKEDREGIMFVGRYTKLKGVHDLLEVARKLPEISFYLVGDDNYKINLKNVKNIGSLNYSEVLNEYKKHEILILPSYTEAFPMTILEAMANGLVVLVSDIPGMREIIKDGRNGYLFKPGDTEKIREIIKELYSKPEEIQRISDNNYNDVWKFIEDKQVPKYEKIYQEIIKN